MRYRFKQPALYADAFQFTIDLAIAALIDRKELPMPSLSVSGSFHSGDRRVCVAWLTVNSKAMLTGTKKRCEIGDWVLLHGSGAFSFMGDQEFRNTYEEAPL